MNTRILLIALDWCKEKLKTRPTLGRPPLSLWTKELRRGVAILGAAHPHSRPILGKLYSVLLRPDHSSLRAVLVGGRCFPLV